MGFRHLTVGFCKPIKYCVNDNFQVYNLNNTIHILDQGFVGSVIKLKIV